MFNAEQGNEQKKKNCVKLKMSSKKNNEKTAKKE